MEAFVFDRFRGIDTRPGQFGRDTRGCVDATNLDFRTGGVISRRPAIVKVTDLDPESVGLYARGGRLHAIVPGGHGIQNRRPAEVTYDPIGADSSHLTAITVTANGSGYTSPPTVLLTGGGATVPGTAIATLSNDQVDRIMVVTPGSGYTSAPTVTLLGGGGSGATATAALTTAAAYPLGVLERLVAADTFGVHPVYGPHGYVAVKRRDNGRVEHHWLKAPPTDPMSPVLTRVSLPFQPGDALIKLATKFFAPAPDEGNVRFSSSENGPSDWTEPEDAGFVPVQSHLSGNRDLLTLSHYRGNLAAFFHDAIQIWRADADPAFIELLQLLNGPGAILAGAVANVLGDVIYLSRGGFRTLSTATVTGEANENDLGAGIRSLTDAIDGSTPAVSQWSQARSQFICVIGSTAYVLTFLPSEKMAEWSTWSLPVAIEYLVELDGVLYARGGNALYRFDNGVSSDLNGTAVLTTWESAPLTLGAPSLRKTLHWITVRQTAPSTMRLIVDGVELKPRQLPACSPRPLRVPVCAEGRQVAVRLTTSSVDWRLEGLAVEFEPQAA